jgi:acyl carrier protein
MSMSEADVLLKLREHVALLLGCSAEQVDAKRPLHELGLDSMGFVDLLVFIEKQFSLPLMASRLAQADFGSLSLLTRRIMAALPK